MIADLWRQSSIQDKDLLLRQHSLAAATDTTLLAPRPTPAVVGVLRSAFSLPDDQARYRALDGVRALAVILVYFVHFYAVFKPWMPSSGQTAEWSLVLATLGNSGVDIFFGISGVLIYRHLLRTRATYGSFLRRRLVRIYPTFLAVFAVYLTLSAVFPNESKLPQGMAATLKYLAANILLLPGIFEVEPVITVAWSLSYEFAFYLSLPPLVWLLRLSRWQSSQRLLLLGLVCGAVLLLQALVPLGHIRMLYFVAGMIAFEASELLKGHRIVVSRAWLLQLPLLGILLVAMGTRYLGGWLFLVLSLAVFAIFLTGALLDETQIARVLMWRPLRGLGMISYSYYLIHGLTLKALAMAFGMAVLPRELDPVSYWSLLVCALFATFVSAAVLYFAIEWRFSLRKAGLAHRMQTAAARAS